MLQLLTGDSDPMVLFQVKPCAQCHKIAWLHFHNHGIPKMKKDLDFLLQMLLGLFLAPNGEITIQSIFMIMMIIIIAHHFNQMESWK